jgi:hypothetical protein
MLKKKLKTIAQLRFELFFLVLICAELAHLRFWRLTLYDLNKKNQNNSQKE